MCLLTIQSKPLVAEEDIICYKVYFKSKNWYESPVMGDIVTELNQVLKTNLQKSTLGGEVYEGYHSFKYKESADTLYPNNGKVCVKCIIPKGSLYYKGIHDFIFREDDGYCSDTIILCAEEPIGEKKPNIFKRIINKLFN